MKIQTILCLSLISLLSLTSCNDVATDTQKAKDVLTIYNCEEYICNDLIESFEEEYNVKALERG